MSQVFEKDGKATPVTLVQAGPCKITQVKTKEKDGYDAVQVGFGNKKKLKKPEKGHLEKKGIKESYKYLKEFKISDPKSVGKVGDEIKVDTFKEGDSVQVTGRTKGKGFQGVIKRHNFAGGQATHGHRHVLRASGSTGGMFPQRTRKGQKMAGRMGDEKMTQTDRKVIKVDAEKGMIAIKGSVPGRHGSLVIIKGI